MFKKYLIYAFGEILLVVIGILIALQVNNWNESKKSIDESKEYLRSFKEENNLNKKNLISVMEFSRSNKNDIDTLKNILLEKKYDDKRIKTLIASMMSLTDFSPSETTMENITSSGKFDLIKNIEVKKSIINTYKAYETTSSIEDLINNYVNTYITPYFFKNVRFSDFSSIKNDFVKDPLFENIVFGYDVLIQQQIRAYESNLERVNLLSEQL